jgi:hypothetical protein
VTREDWPLGPALKRKRELAGLSVRAAARLTNKAVSSGRWYQLESGYQPNKGNLIPIGTTASTVAAAANAVGWDANEALAIAGFRVIQVEPEAIDADAVDASKLSNDVLIGELARRLKWRSAPRDETEPEDGLVRQAFSDGAEDDLEGEDFGQR